MLDYKCVNCGAPSSALYKTYGPSVLKLTKCAICKGIVDKYIEYDPVIVMIDLVLVCKEAQRHVIYNIEFKSYWKLFIILIMLETYGLWRNESLFNMYVNTLCDIHGESTNTTYLRLPFDVPAPDSWKEGCWAWRPQQRGSAHEDELFIWEKDFYIQFISVFTGILAFLLTTHVSMALLRPFLRQNRVSARLVAKSFPLAQSSVALSLAALVWAADAAPDTRALHHLLGAAYTFVIYLSVFAVVYECGTAATGLVVAASACAKCWASYRLTVALRAALV